MKFEQKLIAALVSLGASVALNIYLYYLQNRRKGELTNTATTPASPTSIPPSQLAPEQLRDAQLVASGEVFDEQMNRTLLYYGPEAFEKIKKGFVIVVGVGGVGSAAAHVLLRSGVSRIRIIDPDLVTLSSLNRNSLAQRQDVGRSKVQVLKDYFEKICPETVVETFEAFFTGEMAPILLSGNPDFVLDCIDNKQTKLELMIYCKQNNLKIISAFGAGSANDPTKINICDLKDSFGCVFGKSIRRNLRNKGVNEGILCVTSTEAHKKKLIKLTEEELKIAQAEEVKRGIRLSKIGVAMPIPSVSYLRLVFYCEVYFRQTRWTNTYLTKIKIFGTVMANCVLSSFANLPVIYKEERRVGGPSIFHQKLQKMYTKYELDDFRTSPNETRSIFTINTVKFLMDQFKGVSVLSGEATGTGRLVRWRASEGMSLSNIIYVTKKEFDIHEKIESVEIAYPPDLVAKVDKLLRDITDAENN